MQTPLSKRPPAARSPSWLLFGVLCATTAGCDQVERWDTEFECKGQEQSIATFAGDAPDKAARKTYPFNIDFHLRGQTGMVRSSLVTVGPGPGDMVRFEAKGQDVWVSGQFDKRSNTLSLVENRTLDIEGRPQQVRLTGQYICEAVSARSPSA
ncbi:hypothetical protein [Hydrogenophaga sp. PAMC20947]|uniref:hypothetical protein n=1 Tax=Hydrogenophaga sp. PAMC20947 TaxID=2565558 RepID=UPI00109E005A|nr:hypothetical protein [Hydrogenophaga sp. PAMC20947]QCB46301.1 hypothetical protein E5678_09870 [Hydrogenophaga sp. PAMC20947]